MTVINPNSISGITSITLPSGDGNVLTIHTNDGTERFRIDSSGNVKIGTAATISPDGDLFVTGVTTTGGHFAGSGANLTSLPAAQLTGALPAISGANLTGIAATDNVRTGILDVAGVSTFRNTMNVGAAVTISESGIEASGIGITVANINGGAVGGRRNLIINGDMRIAQRATSSTTNGYQTVDRWYGYANDIGSITATWSQGTLTSSDTPYSSGFRRYHRVTLSSAGTANAGSQVSTQTRIEAQDISTSGWNYTSSTSFLTASCWVRASTGQTFYLRITSEDGTKQNIPFAFTVADNTWTKVIWTLPGNSNVQFDNDSGEGLRFYLIPWHGTNYTSSDTANDTWAAYASGTRVPDMASTWLTAGASTFDYTGVQLEVGPQATPFEHRSFGEEVLLCQRYFQQISMSTILPCASNGSSQMGNVSIPVSVPMRASPTIASGITYHAWHGNNDGQNNDGTALVVANFDNNNSPLESHMMQGTLNGFSSLTDNRIGGITANSGTPIKMDAEL